jgi:hypothetical protein
MTSKFEVVPSFRNTRTRHVVVSTGPLEMATSNYDFQIYIYCHQKDLSYVYYGSVTVFLDTTKITERSTSQFSFLLPPFKKIPYPCE